MRAVEIRAIAEFVMSRENKARLLKIADDYEHMADLIENVGLADGPALPNPKSGA